MQTPSHSDSSQRQVIPFTTYVDKEQAPKEFIKRLHHTHNFERPGYIFFVSLKEKSPRQFASTSLSKYSNVENIYSQLGYRRDTYISVNEFRSDKERDTDKAYSIHVLYLDLDFHIVDENGLCQSESIKSLVEKAKQHLSTLILTGDLLMPSCITDTGRGLGIFYILDSAIAVTQKTEKLRNFYTFIYDLLMKRFKTLFCDIYPNAVRHVSLSSSFRGYFTAAIAESTTVKRMVLVPPDSSEITGSTEAAKLAAKASRTKAPTTRFTRAGGMMIARNMP